MISTSATYTYSNPPPSTSIFNKLLAINRYDMIALISEVLNTYIITHEHTLIPQEEMCGASGTHTSPSHTLYPILLAIALHQSYILPSLTALSSKYAQALLRSFYWTFKLLHIESIDVHGMILFHRASRLDHLWRVLKVLNRWMSSPILVIVVHDSGKFY